LDQGSPPAGWQSASFDDRAWARGVGQFGFGDGDEQTVLDNRGADGQRITAAYFRTSFEVADRSGVGSTTLQLLADDGAVVWLNGQRVISDNMTTGPVDHETLSLSGRWGSAERSFRAFFLPTSALVDGTNTVAVEVHQRDPYSSDLSFAASIDLTRQVPLPPTTTPPTTTPITAPPTTAPPTTAPPTTPTTAPPTTTPPTTVGPIPTTISFDEVVIALGSSWRYFDQGPAPQAWRSAGFDDSDWASGRGQLGFGDNDESTRLSRSVNGRGLHTGYFRHQVDLASGIDLDRATLELVADDGAVVWINGRRVVNDNITAGPVGYWTLSDTGRWGSAERTSRTFSLPPDAFRAGRNTVAIEVHQRQEWSSDLSFDAAITLSGTVGG
jgi:hypothetical protein